MKTKKIMRNAKRTTRKTTRKIATKKKTTKNLKMIVMRGLIIKKIRILMLKPI